LETEIVNTIDLKTVDVKCKISTKHQPILKNYATNCFVWAKYPAVKCAPGKGCAATNNQYAIMSRKTHSYWDSTWGGARGGQLTLGGTYWNSSSGLLTILSAVGSGSSFLPLAKCSRDSFCGRQEWI